MHQRFIVVLAAVCVALGTGGCRSTTGYEEALFPMQTGSRIQRHTEVPVQPEKKSEKKKEEKKKAPKPEPSATPTPEEESTPPPADRFR